MAVDWNRHRRRRREAQWFTDEWWEQNADPALETVLVASVCLLVASWRPEPLFAATLAGLLWLAATAYALAAALRGEGFEGTALNRWHQALFLAGLGTLCGLLVDPEAMRSLAESSRSSVAEVAR